MLRRLRRTMALLCGAGVCVIGILLVAVSLIISEAQLTERGQALFQSRVNTVAFRVSNDMVVNWTWLQQVETEGGLLIHLEDNGEPMLFSSRGYGEQTRALVRQAQQIAAEQHGVDTARRPVSALRSSQANFRMVAEDGVEYAASITVFRTELGFRSVTALGDLTAERAAILHQRLIYLALLLACVAALLLFSWFFAGWAIRPIERSQRQQAEFIAAASHELRSPLAVIRTSAAALGEEADNRFVGAIERECVRTGKLVDDLLTLAGADADRWRVEFGPVELGELLADSAAKFRARTASKGLDLRLEIPSPLPLITGDAFRLQQTVDILLDNACHYTPAGGRIALRCTAPGRYVRLTVADSGPGIPPALYETVFERFYRVDSARSKKEHYGLGLSIAREIVALHCGRITLSETPGGGLTVEILLPVTLR